MTVVHRSLPGLQHDLDTVLIIDLDGDFLATRKQIVFIECVLVRHQLFFVTAGDESHTAALRGGRRQGHPARDLLRIVEAPIG